MPKRTNDFQKLIKFIYDCITSEGGTVTESGEVFDKDAKELREVDILIEHKISGHPIRIAIECRDRSRNDTVEWIDGLIGKTSSLDVNKVVAVSKRGFSKTAREKAKAHGIDTLTLEEATEKDFASYMIKPGLAIGSGEQFSLRNVLYFSNEQYQKVSELGINSIVQFKGEVVGSVKEVFEEVFLDIVAPRLQDYVKENMLSIFKTRADLKKILYIEKEVDTDGLVIIPEDAVPVEISKIKFIIYGTRQVSDVKQKHEVYNNKLLSTGMHLDVDDSVLKFRILQDPETNRLYANWSREITDGPA